MNSQVLNHRRAYYCHESKSCPVLSDSHKVHRLTLNMYLMQTSAEVAITCGGEEYNVQLMKHNECATLFGSLVPKNITVNLLYKRATTS